MGLLFLTACEPRRGSSDDDDSASPGDSQLGGDLEVPDSDHCESVAGWSGGWSALEWAILEQTNQVRSEGTFCDLDGDGEDDDEEWYPPVGPLEMQENLRCAARIHSVDMLERDFFDHTNPDGLGPAERMTEAGYPWMGFGENIGWGYATANEMMVGWLISPPHCTNARRHAGACAATACSRASAHTAARRSENGE